MKITDLPQMVAAFHSLVRALLLPHFQDPTRVLWNYLLGTQLTASKWELRVMQQVECTM